MTIQNKISTNILKNLHIAPIYSSITVNMNYFEWFMVQETHGINTISFPLSQLTEYNFIIDSCEETFKVWVCEFADVQQKCFSLRTFFVLNPIRLK